MEVTHEGKAEVIEYKGIKFRRYPKSLQWATRNYYTPNASYRKRGVSFLHREVWKDAHGPIPKGYEIHHVDHNPLNNDLSNLQCISRDDHYAHHANGRTLEEIRAKREHIERIRKAAGNWHKSAEGRAWHRQLATMSAEARYTVRRTCEQCGAEFEVDNISAARKVNQARFCSIGCKAAARRESGVDNEDRTCIQCGAVFTVNRYSIAKFCSRTCSVDSRRKRETRQCQVCGKPFDVWPSSKRRYCSNACAYQGMWHQEEVDR